MALGSVFFVGGPSEPWPALVAARVCWWLTGRMEPPSVRRRRERLVASVPHAVDLMAACLAAGPLARGGGRAACRRSSTPRWPTSSLRSPPGSGSGADPATVWRDLARHPQLGGLGRTVSRAVDSGASVAEAMLRLADDLRSRGRADVERRARAVGVQAAAAARAPACCPPSC